MVFYSIVIARFSFQWFPTKNSKGVNLMMPHVIFPNMSHRNLWSTVLSCYNQMLNNYILWLCSLALFETYMQKCDRKTLVITPDQNCCPW